MQLALPDLLGQLGPLELTAARVHLDRLEQWERRVHPVESALLAFRVQMVHPDPWEAPEVLEALAQLD